ncbi:MAG: hypothetical protein ACREYE_10645 [Gammaproteobacteria bacterium]
MARSDVRFGKNSFLLHDCKGLHAIFNKGCLIEEQGMTYLPGTDWDPAFVPLHWVAHARY